MIAKKRGIALIISLILLVSMAVVPVFADTANTSTQYTPVAGTTFSFNKYLVVDKNTEIPAAEFSYSITALENAIAASTQDSTLEVLPGPNPEKVNVDKATFTAGQNTTDGAADDGITNDETKKYATASNVKVDFKDVTFPEPGVYRYFIEEKLPNSSFGCDHPVKTIDVYVEDDTEAEAATPALKVAGYVMYEDKLGGAAPKINVGDGKQVTDKPNGAEAGTKTDKFINKYPVNTLTIKKTVAGNQGSKDQYFKFTIKLTGEAVSSISDTANFKIEGQDKEPQKNQATNSEYTADVMKNANNKEYIKGKDLKDGYAIYLQHNDIVTIYGIPEECGYEIVEVNEDYTVGTVTAKDGESTTVSGTSEKVSGDKFEKNVTVTYTNTKTGIIPTGILLTATPWIIFVAFVIAGVIFFSIRSRRQFDEE